MSAALWEGDVFAGKYRVDKVLGQGGMGMVLGAHHLGLDEPVAIKVLLPAMLEIPGMVERFLREAKAAAKIKNEHVARVTDVDALPSGVPYIVMERLDGLDLAALCKQKKRLSIEESSRYLLEACEAIAEAHEIGIIHRDLKPGNIFLAKKRDGSSTIKVLDFGISKLTGVLAQHQATTVGTVLGSPSYMSPEQMASAPDVDGRTDIWALGAILYQLTTGELPFRGDSLPQICMKVLQAAPARPTEIREDFPSDFEALILRCLEKDREARFATVKDLMAALRPFSGVVATPVAPVPKVEEIAAPEQPSEATAMLVPTQQLGESIVSSAVTLLRPQASTRSGRMARVAGAAAVAIVLMSGVALVLKRDPRPSSTVAATSSTTMTTSAPSTLAIASTAMTAVPAPTPDVPSVMPSANVLPPSPTVAAPDVTTAKPAAPPAKAKAASPEQPAATAQAPNPFAVSAQTPAAKPSAKPAKAALPPGKTPFD